MVRSRKRSKRITLKDKYKVERRVVEHGRKKRKQAKKDLKMGKVQQKRKDPGIPSSWPFKAELLEEIARAKENEEAIKNQTKVLKKKTIADLMAEATASRTQFETKQMDVHPIAARNIDGLLGEQSRRAYLRELKKVIDDADIILQVLDARDPAGTRISKSTEETILSHPDKKLVLVLNKVDLIPKEAIKGWLKHLRRSHPTIPVKAGISHNKSVGSGEAEDLLTTSSAVGMESLLQLLKNYARNGDSGVKTCISVGIIGYPNVGKSSIINSLKRSRAVGVSPRPGFTTAMQEVVLDRTVRLLDSPGVVFEDDADVLLKNCITVDSVTDPYMPVESLLKRCSMETVMMTYGLPRYNSTDMFLAMIARKFGMVKKRGIPDKMSAGKMVLRDWNAGKIPYFTPPPEHEVVDTQKGEATIVSAFGKAYEFDSEVIKTLDEKDEIDFIRLSDGTRSQTNALTVKEQDMEMEDSENNGENTKMNEEKAKKDAAASAVHNEKMADAEDFDFTSM